MGSPTIPDSDAATSSKSKPAARQPDLYTGEPPLQSALNTWTGVKSDLSYALGANVHKAWTARLRVVHADERTVTLGAPMRVIADKVQSHYLDTVQRLWKKHDQVDPPRQVILSDTPAGQMGRATPAKRSTAVSGQSADKSDSKKIINFDDALKGPSASTARDMPALDNPRERFTFENFVTGPSNELAVAVAKQVAAGRASQYNPVVIHGANGMGKTHLLYAIEDAACQNNPDVRIQFVKAENFVSTFVSSVRGQGSRAQMDAFKAALRDVDLLIIDDAHFIADKPGSQEELLHTLVSLVDAGRQILIATDKHPDKIEKASERLKSYLSSGLVCRIGPADFELRLRILDRLIARRRAGGHATLAIPQNARDHLAARMNATPRDLEGAFNQIVAQSEFLGTAITLETVQETLSDSRYNAGQRLTVDKIQKAVCEEFRVTMTDMTSKRRARAIARPRQVAMYLSKKLTKRSLPDIGRRFGGRDHTTVMHAVKRIKELRETETALNAQIENVEAALKR